MQLKVNQVVCEKPLRGFSTFFRTINAHSFVFRKIVNVLRRKIFPSMWSRIALFQARNSKSERANDRMNVLAKWQPFRKTVSFDPLYARFHSSIRVCTSALVRGMCSSNVLFHARYSAYA